MSTDFETQLTDQPPPQVIVQESRSGRGCLYGCLFLFLATVAVVVCSGLGIYWFISDQVNRYTAETPAELPTVEYPPEQLEALEAKVDSFSSALKKDEPPAEDLVLSADDINALIAKDEHLKGKVHIDIEDGKVTGQLSIPTDFLPGGKGRYFNGSATLDVSMQNGVLIVTLVDAEVNGEPVPQEFIDAMAAQNLAQDLYKNPETAKTLRKIESVEIDDDKLILKVKRDQTENGDSSENNASDANQGESGDAGENQTDANQSSETQPDANQSDANQSDASQPDANQPDASQSDANSSETSASVAN